MKSLTNFLILLVVTLGLSCTRNDPPTIDLNNERICDSLICSIGSICFDTSSIQNIKKEELIGTWILKYFVTLNNCEIDSAPLLHEKNINMTFFENDSIAGRTIVNSFEADYLIDSTELIINNFILTKICCDPNWVSEFSSFIHNEHIIKIKDSTLIIYYKNTQKAFLFNK